MMDRIAVLIPCWNEALTIEKVVSDFKRVLPEAVIYVYDNNSTDCTADLAARAGAVVRHEYRQEGNVIRSMFRDVDADCYVMVDGDDTYPAENARDMVNLVLEERRIWSSVTVFPPPILRKTKDPSIIPATCWSAVSSIYSGEKAVMKSKTS